MRHTCAVSIALQPLRLSIQSLQYCPVYQFVGRGSSQTMQRLVESQDAFSYQIPLERKNGQVFMLLAHVDYMTDTRRETFGQEKVGAADCVSRRRCEYVFGTDTHRDEASLSQSEYCMSGVLLLFALFAIRPFVVPLVRHNFHVGFTLAKHISCQIG